MSLHACGSACGLDILEIYPWIVSLVQSYLVWPRGVLVSACELSYVWKHTVSPLVVKIHITRLCQGQCEGC